jgi:biopolymer transport protein ExbD
MAAVVRRKRRLMGETNVVPYIDVSYAASSS